MRKIQGLERYRGLMFRSRNTEPLEFVFDKDVHIAIHSLFVFFSFYAYWFSSKGELIEKRLVKPFRINIRPEKSFRVLMEIPILNDNHRNSLQGRSVRVRRIFGRWFLRERTKKRGYPVAC